MTRKAVPRKTINIALQGGGAHGAFTWGVLDVLLEDGRLAIEAISGTSAGAMNAVALADGMAAAGREGAREKLYEFWRSISSQAAQGQLGKTPWERLFGPSSLMTAGRKTLLDYFDVMARVVSPYDVNPLNINPLKDILEAHVDFERVRNFTDMKLFISATNVQTGRAKVFTGHEITADAVMASACLPFLFQAVEIDGEPYWDGGYMGNPVLYPFFEHCQSQDVVIVQINPVRRDGVPRSARDIMNRLNEITFNASLLKELRLVQFVNRCLERGELTDLGFRKILLHRVDGEDELKAFTAQTKLIADWEMLKKLHDIGQRQARSWLDANFDKIGMESSLDIHSFFDHSPFWEEEVERRRWRLFRRY